MRAQLRLTTLPPEKAGDSRRAHCHARMAHASFLAPPGDFGRLGHGHAADCFSPQPISGLAGIAIRQVACGDAHTLVVAEAGELYVFGRNQNGGDPAEAAAAAARGSWVPVRGWGAGQQGRDRVRRPPVAGAFFAAPLHRSVIAAPPPGPLTKRYRPAGCRHHRGRPRTAPRRRVVGAGAGREGLGRRGAS